MQVLELARHYAERRHVFAVQLSTRYSDVHAKKVLEFLVAHTPPEVFISSIIALV
jgi:hypothetical protein